MKRNKLLMVSALACLVLTSCGKTEITADEAKEIAKSASEFKTSEYNFIKVSTTFKKYDVTSGNATIYKELINKITPIEVGKASTQTYQYSEQYANYVITKEAIEAVKQSGSTTTKFYKDGNKLSVSNSMSEEQKLGNLSFKIVTSATNEYDANGYMTSGTATLDFTFTDNSTCSQVIETKVEWVK